MKQIRLGWTAGLRRDSAGNTLLGGPWIEDTFESRAELARIAATANANFGRSTHWLEEREYSTEGVEH